MLPSSSTAVMVTLKDVPTVGVEVAGTTEKEPAPTPSAGVVVEVTVVVVVPAETVPGPTSSWSAGPRWWWSTSSSTRS